MHSQSREIEVPLSPHGRNRVLGVIVLTDNRQHPPTGKTNMPNYRCSAFRCKNCHMQRRKQTHLSFTRKGESIERGSWINWHKGSLPWSSDCWNWHSLRPPTVSARSERADLVVRRSNGEGLRTLSAISR